MLPSVFAFLANSISLSLSSVHKGITYPLNLNKDSKPEQESIEDTSDEPEKCVECIVLHHPQNVEADVIFMHGLHGSIEKTWKQGLWRHEKHKLRHERMSRSMSTCEVLKEKRTNFSLKRSTSETYFLPSKVAKKDAISNVGDSIVFTEEVHEYSTCWPKDWLPMDCPGARVIAVNYTTDPYLWRPVWVKKQNRTDMNERSKEIYQQLRELGVGDKPIIWVGHSKGGLFIKKMLIDGKWYVLLKYKLVIRLDTLI